jgi:hypothetical protein
MRYRPPKQLHASLYMRDKKKSTNSKVSKEAKSSKSVTSKKTCRAKK